MPSASTRALAAVSELAAGQWGLLTTAQAQREGITRLQLARLAEAGVLERIDRGAYATVSSPTEGRELRAAWLALDPSRTAEERLADLTTTGVVSHTAAAGLHRLGDLLDDEPEFTLPHRKQTRRGMRLHRAILTERDVTLVDGLPTTTEERTVADLLRDGHDPEHVAQIIGQGVRRGVIDLDDLAERLGPLAHRNGQPDGRALVEHLLDVVGLSAAALVRDLAESAAGRQLVAAGRADVLARLATSLLPLFSAAEVLDLPKLAANLFSSIGFSRLIDVSDVVAPSLARLAESVHTTGMLTALDATQSAAFHDAIAAASSSFMNSSLSWPNSDAGRHTDAAASAVTPPADAEDDE